ncbi:MAG TPA: HAD hydrolase-like protein, partial [Ruminiclostridium sp.]|nr:HAD hydrolase-like protein [Ruminiclostridium sp.]
YELFAERVIRHFELDGFFDKIAGAPKDIEKPWLKKDSIKRALEGFSDANSSNTVIIGDRKFDAEGAKEAGIDSIGVLFGYGKSDELEASSFNMIVPDVKTLTDVLLKDK